MKISREKLLNSGFKRETIEELGKVGLVLYLRKGNDRFLHRLRWHSECPEELLIDRYLTRGINTISKEDFLLNTNGFTTNAVEHYKEILKELFKKQ